MTLRVATNYAMATSSYSKSLPEPRVAYVVDMFSGCGGMSCGFASTRQSHWAYKILGGIDLDNVALKTYEKNIHARAVKWDVRMLAEHPEMLERLLPEFDVAKCRPLVFIGCPPCQGFSAHRKKDERDDPRNNLIATFAKICSHYLPDVVAMENVPEILNGKYRQYFAAAEAMLASSGYRITKAIMDLSLFGVPQRRRRAIVMAYRGQEVRLPSPVFGREDVLTVRHAISHLPELEAGDSDPQDVNHKAPKHTARILARIAATPADGGDRRVLPADKQLRCHAALDSGATPGFADVYGRLRWDSPSVTITAKSSTPSCGRFIHPEQNRNITVREAAILQGFPQSYVFEGPMVHQYRQVGEAVPPVFARFIAWQILDSFSRSESNAGATTVLGISGPVNVRREEAGSVAFVDCFCGAGGLGLGFKAAGLRGAYAFDTDEDSVETFRRNVAALAADNDVLSPELPDAIASAVGSREYILVGGPPCQGFSQQRRGSGQDDRNNLVTAYAELVPKLHRLPMGVVLENVTYLDSPRGREILARFMAILDRLGYRLFRHDMNSAEYAVPQLRRRIVVVALEANLAESYRGPIPITPRRWPTVGEVLCGLPAPDNRSLLGLLVSNHVTSNESEMNKRRIAFVDMGHGRMSIPPSLQLPCHTKYDGHLDVYGRLDWFSQARTITGGFDSFTRGEYAHPFLHRSITAREAARIQGFPDWFTFHGNKASVRHQIGNAVPPPLAMALGRAIIDAIESKGGRIR